MRPITIGRRSCMPVLFIRLKSLSKGNRTAILRGPAGRAWYAARSSELDTRLYLPLSITVGGCVGVGREIRDLPKSRVVEIVIGILELCPVEEVEVIELQDGLHALANEEMLRDVRI